MEENKFYAIGLDCIALNVFWISFWSFLEEFNACDDPLFWMSALIVWAADLMQTLYLTLITCKDIWIH